MALSEQARKELYNDAYALHLKKLGITEDTASDEDKSMAEADALSFVRGVEANLA